MVQVKDSNGNVAEVSADEWERVQKHQTGEELAAPCIVYAFQVRALTWRGHSLTTLEVSERVRVMFARVRPTDDERILRVG